MPHPKPDCAVCVHADVAYDHLPCRNCVHNDVSDLLRRYRDNHFKPMPPTITPAPLTPRKHAALIKAWADGAIIQVQAPDKSWDDVPCNTPHWASNVAYRVKPAAVIKSMRVILEDDLIWTYSTAQTDNLELTFTEGKLTSAKVLP